MKNVFINAINFYENYELFDINEVFNKIDQTPSDLFSLDEFTNNELYLLIKILDYYILKNIENDIKNDIKLEKKLLVNLKIIYDKSNF